jgi:hypothetical protein
MWVVILIVRIEHLSISITRINGFNTTSIRWDMNRFGWSKNMLDSAMTFVPLNEASHHTASQFTVVAVLLARRGFCYS